MQIIDLVSSSSPTSYGTTTPASASISRQSGLGHHCYAVDESENGAGRDGDGRRVSHEFYRAQSTPASAAAAAMTVQAHFTKVTPETDMYHTSSDDLPDIDSLLDCRFETATALFEKHPQPQLAQKRLRQSGGLKKSFSDLGSPYSALHALTTRTRTKKPKLDIVPCFAVEDEEVHDIEQILNPKSVCSPMHELTERTDHCVTPGENKNSERTESDNIFHKSRSASMQFDAQTVGTDTAKQLSEQDQLKCPETKAEKQARLISERELKNLQKLKRAELKKREKAIDAVNKIKPSRKDWTPDMIIEVSKDINGSALVSHLQNFISDYGSQLSIWETSSKSVIKWRRKVYAEYSHELGYNLPIPERVDEEAYLLLYLQAPTFVKVVLESSSWDRLPSVLAEGCSCTLLKQKPIYVIEGLQLYIKKARNATNKEYTNSVRQAMGDNTAISNQVSKAKTKLQPFELDLIEKALVHLQFTQDCLIMHTTCVADTAEQIAALTGEIAIRPEKYNQCLSNNYLITFRNMQANYDISFCMDAGQIKTGVDEFDTFSKMLQEVNRVTPILADAIMQKYPTFRSLFETFEEIGPDALSEISVRHLFIS